MAKEKAKATGPGLAKTRGGKPALLGDPGGPFAWRHIRPKSKVHAPVRVWAQVTATGFRGWVDQFKATQVLPTVWDNTWEEVIQGGNVVPSEPVQKRRKAG